MNQAASYLASREIPGGILQKSSTKWKAFVGRRVGQGSHQQEKNKSSLEESEFRVATASRG